MLKKIFLVVAIVFAILLVVAVAVKTVNYFRYRPEVVCNGQSTDPDVMPEFNRFRDAVSNLTEVLDCTCFDLGCSRCDPDSGEYGSYSLFYLGDSFIVSKRKLDNVVDVYSYSLQGEKGENLCSDVKRQECPTLKKLEEGESMVGAELKKLYLAERDSAEGKFSSKDEFELMLFGLYLETYASHDYIHVCKNGLLVNNRIVPEPMTEIQLRSFSGDDTSTYCSSWGGMPRGFLQIVFGITEDLFFGCRAPTGCIRADKYLELLREKCG